MQQWLQLNPFALYDYGKLKILKITKLPIPNGDLSTKCLKNLGSQEVAVCDITMSPSYGYSV